MKVENKIGRLLLYKAFMRSDNDDHELRSPIGKNLPWSLPRGSKPGQWQHHKGRLKMCVRGLHVSCGAADVNYRFGAFSERAARRYRVFRVAVDVTGMKESGLPRWADESRKICVRSVRLLREVRHGSREWRRLMR